MLIQLYCSNLTFSNQNWSDTIYEHRKSCRFGGRYNGRDDRGTSCECGYSNPFIGHCTARIDAGRDGKRTDD